MRKLLITLTVVMALCFTTNSALAGDPNDNDPATCTITASVDQIVEWEGANFAAMSCAVITAQADTPTDSEAYTLWLNCNVELSANNTGTVAQLTHSSTSDYLVTKYKISTDGDADPDTGADATAVTASGSNTWRTHTNFLTTPLAITHVDNDGAVEVTLEVQASNDMTGHYEVADAGSYGSCEQTITATWTSD